MWGSRREFFRPFFCPSRKEWIKFSIAFEGDRKVGARNQLKLDGPDLQVGWGTWLVTPGHATAVLYYSGNAEIQMTIQRSPSWAINHNFLQLEKEYKKYIKNNILDYGIWIVYVEYFKYYLIMKLYKRMTQINVFNHIDQMRPPHNQCGMTDASLWRARAQYIYQNTLHTALYL